MNKNIMVFALVMLMLGSVATYSAPSALADWLIDRSGTLVKLDPRILGEDDVTEEEVKKPESQSVEQKSDNKEQEKEQEKAKKASEDAKHELEKKIEVNVVKAKTSNTEKESEIEVDGNKIKIKQKTKDASGKETETQMELKDGEELQVESKDGDETEKIHISPGEDNSVEIEHGNTSISTKLPISLNADNELVVTKKDGTQKVVTVMPDQALAKLTEENILSNDSASLPELEEEDGESVYKIDGEKQEKVLGIFKVSFKTKATVSAETGEVLSIELTGFDKFLSLFSF